MRLDWQRIVLVLLSASVLSLAQRFEAALITNANRLIATEVVIFGLIAFSFLFLAFMKQPPHWTNSYVLFTALLAFIMYTATLTLSVPYALDAPAAVHYATKLFLDGKNPYVAFDIGECLRTFNLTPDVFGTKLMDGSLEQYFNYPAGSFLWIAPFIAAGLSDTRIIYSAALVVMMLFIHHRADESSKNIVVLGFLSNVVIRDFAIGGLPEPLWALPLLLGWGWRDKRLKSALAIGIATTIKQLAWFFVPYYAVMTFKEYGAKEAMRRFSMIVVVFAVTNLPFIVQDPAVWLRSILGPMLDPMVPMGVGLVALENSQLFDLLPRPAYLLLELAVFCVALVWYYRQYHNMKEAAMILATLPLWFAWRSLLSYFYLSGILMIGAIIMEKARENARQAEKAVPAGVPAVAN